MAVVPKKLNFQLCFRNKTKTRKIIGRDFRLQKLLKKDSNNSSCFYYTIVINEEHKSLLKSQYIHRKKFLFKPFLTNRIKPNNHHRIHFKKIKESNVQLRSQTNNNSLKLQKCFSTGWLLNKNYFLNKVFNPDYIFLKKKKAVSSKLPKASKLLFGCYGIYFKEYSIISSKSVETAKLDIARNLQKKGRFWIRICCDTPVSARPAETRMGKGKGSISYWAAKASPGQLFFEFSGISLVQLKEIYQKLSKKSAVSLKILY